MTDNSEVAMKAIPRPVDINQFLDRWKGHEERNRGSMSRAGRDIPILFTIHTAVTMDQDVEGNKKRGHFGHTAINL